MDSKKGLAYIIRYRQAIKQAKKKIMENGKTTTVTVNKKDPHHSSQIIVCSIPLIKLAESKLKHIVDDDWRLVAKWTGTIDFGPARIATRNMGSFEAGHPTDIACVPQGGRTYLYIGMNHVPNYRKGKSEKPRRMLRVTVEDGGIPASVAESGSATAGYMAERTAVVEGVQKCRSIANSGSSRVALVREARVPFKKLPASSGAKKRVAKLDGEIGKLEKRKKLTSRQRSALSEKRDLRKAIKACVYWRCGVYKLPTGESDFSAKPVAAGRKVFLAYERSVPVGEGKASVTALLGGGGDREIYVGQGMAVSKSQAALVLFDAKNKLANKKAGRPTLSCVVRYNLPKAKGSGGTGRKRPEDLADGTTLFPRGFFSGRSANSKGGYVFEGKALAKSGGVWKMLEFEGVALRRTKVYRSASESEYRSVIVNDNKERSYVRFY